MVNEVSLGQAYDGNFGLPRAVTFH